MISREELINFKSSLDAAGFLVENDEKILLLKRGASETEPGTWGLPGGTVNNREGILKGAFRELGEETGITLFDEFEKKGKFYVRYSDKDFMYHLFLIKFDYRPKVKLSSEHVSFEWVEPAKALGMDLISDLDGALKDVYGL